MYKDLKICFIIISSLISTNILASDLKLNLGLGLGNGLYHQFSCYKLDKNSALCKLEKSNNIYGLIELKYQNIIFLHTSSIINSEFGYGINAVFITKEFDLK